MPEGDLGHGELDEADAAWAEMYGGDGGGVGFDMSGMQAALPAAPTTRLSPELTTFLSGNIEVKQGITRGPCSRGALRGRL